MQFKITDKIRDACTQAKLPYSFMDKKIPKFVLYEVLDISNGVALVKVMHTSTEQYSLIIMILKKGKTTVEISYLYGDVGDVTSISELEELDHFGRTECSHYFDRNHYGNNSRLIDVKDFANKEDLLGVMSNLNISRIAALSDAKRVLLDAITLETSAIEALNLRLGSILTFGVSRTLAKDLEDVQAHATKQRHDAEYKVNMLTANMRYANMRYY